MNCVSWCVVAATTAVLCACVGRSATAADDSRSTAPVRDARAMPLPQPRTAARATMFAPAAAASAKPLDPQQFEERRFLREAAAANRFQAEAGRVALLKSSDAAVRALAAALVNQQSTSGNDLLWLLHERGMAAPMLENAQRKTLNRLGRLKGRTFDREFIDQVGLHSQESAIGAYERASVTVDDPAIKGWIERTLPSLRSQVASAERISSRSVRRIPSASNSR